LSSIEEAATRKQRGEVYGDHHTGNTNVGRIWSGILSQYFQTYLPDIPADIVDLMMAGVKIARVSQPHGRGHQDSFHDARIYLSMGEESSNQINELVKSNATKTTPS
jgi:hypothetical protein